MSKRKRAVAMLAALVALALLVAGCGGGGSGTESSAGTESGTSTESTSTESTALSKAQFVKQGNAICAKGEKELEAAVEKFAEEGNFSKKKGPSATEVRELVEGDLVPVVRNQLDELRALGIPGGDEKELEAIFGAMEEALKKAEENPNVISEGGAGPFAKANKLSREYGLTKCGEE